MNFGACLVLAFIDHKIIWLLPAQADRPVRQPQVFTGIRHCQDHSTEVGCGMGIENSLPSSTQTHLCELKIDMQRLSICSLSFLWLKGGVNFVVPN